MPDHRRIPLALIPANTPAESLAAGSLAAGSSALGSSAAASSGLAGSSSVTVAAVSSAPPDWRESSPPEGTPVRPAAQSQTLTRAEPTQPSLAPLVSSLAHDLNNLLQVISTTTQLLRLREQNKDSQLFLGDIVSATDRAAKLTGQLLEAARSERQRHTDGSD